MKYIPLSFLPYRRKTYAALLIRAHLHGDVTTRNNRELNAFRSLYGAGLVKLVYLDDVKDDKGRGYQQACFALSDVGRVTVQRLLENNNKKGA